MEVLGVLVPDRASFFQASIVPAISALAASRAPFVGKDIEMICRIVLKWFSRKRAVSLPLRRPEDPAIYRLRVYAPSTEYVVVYTLPQASGLSLIATVGAIALKQEPRQVLRISKKPAWK